MNHNALLLAGWSLYLVGQALDPSASFVRWVLDGGALAILALWLWFERQARLKAETRGDARTDELIATLRSLREHERQS